MYSCRSLCPLSQSRFTNHLWPRDLNRSRVGHQTQPLVWPLIAPKGTFDQTGYLKSVLHTWIELSPLQKDLTALVLRLITGLMQVVEQRRSWTLIVQVVKGLCDLFSWGWMTPDFMMRQHRWKFLLSLFDACGKSVVAAPVLLEKMKTFIHKALKCHLQIISNLNKVSWANICCKAHIYMSTVESLHSNCDLSFGTQLINCVLQH